MARLNHYMDSWGMLSVMLHGLSEMADYYMVLTRCVLVCFVYICRRKPYTMKLLASIGNTIMYLLCVIVAWLGLTPLAAYAVPRLPEPEFDPKEVVRRRISREFLSSQGLIRQCQMDSRSDMGFSLL